MKKIACFLTAAMLAAAAAGSAGALPARAAETPIDVWLIGGQSNAVGFAQGSVSSQDERFTTGFGNVLFWGDYESDDATKVPADFVPVREGLGKAYSNGTTRSGAELGIASALADSGTMNAVIKSAWGATFLYPDTANSVSVRWGTWTPPSYLEAHPEAAVSGDIGQLYENFLGVVAEGLEKLRAKGYAPVIRGMWWMQGEAESNNAAMANAYYELLTDLISDLRSDLTRITGQDLSAMPFVIGKIYRNPAYSAMSQIQTVRAAQQQAAETLANVATVDCTGLEQHDGWHFVPDAQLWLGEQFVRSVSEMDGKFWVSCASEHVSFAGGGVKEAGDPVTVTVSAVRGYRIEEVRMQTGTGEAVTVSMINGRYSFSMPAANVAFTVVTSALPRFRLQYTVNDGSMGAVYPSAEAKEGWYAGEQVEVFVRAAAGYVVRTVTVNGTELSPVREQNGGFVYVVDTAADAALNVVFAKETADAPAGGDDVPAGGDDAPSEAAPDGGNAGLWIGLGAGAVLVAAGVAAFVLLRKKRR